MWYNISIIYIYIYTICYILYLLYIIHVLYNIYIYIYNIFIYMYITHTHIYIYNVCYKWRSCASQWRSGFVNILCEWEYQQYFPTCQVRVKFYVSSSSSSAGPQLQALDRSVLCRTRTASPRSERSLPDLNCKLGIAAVPAGPEQQAQDQSGPCRTSTDNCKR